MSDEKLANESINLGISEILSLDPEQQKEVATEEQAISQDPITNLESESINKTSETQISDLEAYARNDAERKILSVGEAFKNGDLPEFLAASALIEAAESIVDPNPKIAAYAADVSRQLAARLLVQGEGDLAIELNNLFKTSAKKQLNVAEVSQKIIRKKNSRWLLVLLIIIPLAGLQYVLWTKEKPIEVKAQESLPIVIAPKIEPVFKIDLAKIEPREASKDSVLNAIIKYEEQASPSDLPPQAASSVMPLPVQKVSIDLNQPKETAELTAVLDGNIVDDAQPSPSDTAFLRGITKEDPIVPGFPGMDPNVKNKDSFGIKPIYRIMHSTRVYNSPDYNAQILDRLSPGQNVRVVEEQGSWLKIRAADGRVAYIPADSVQKP